MTGHGPSGGDNHGVVDRRVNVDDVTVRHFGREWTDFDQSSVNAAELDAVFERYFRIFPWDRLPPDSRGMDFGCGSGRWGFRVAQRVGFLHCVDASEAALAVTRRNMTSLSNWDAHRSTADDLPFPENSLDFAYSLGVLHHIPDTAAGMRACVSKLKPGAPFLVYLYYRFDNRRAWYRALWMASDALRRALSAAPHRVKIAATGAIAAMVYWPLARMAGRLSGLGVDVSSVPLSFYRDASFYTMRTDALDRFGTPLERRFTANEIREMMTASGLEAIRFSDQPPYWCAVGFKRVKRT